MISSSKSTNTWFYPTLLFLGASILFYRTVSMVKDGAVSILATCVASSIFIEMFFDFSCMASSLIWLILFHGDSKRAGFSLRLGAIATIIHAFRVLIFVLGRVGFNVFGLRVPINFDVRPEHRALHSNRWTWGQVYFASVMSILGTVGVMIIWHIRKRSSDVTRKLKE